MAADGMAQCENTLSQQVELTILMPCLNEARTLPACIGKALGFLARNGICGEVLVADNGSTDGSPGLAENLGARVIEVAARGYGSALIAGIRAARGDYVIMGDSDDSYDFERLEPFVAALRGGADLVMGNRFAGGIAAGAMPFLHRYLGNPVLTGLGRLLFRAPCGDFHCGLRGFARLPILRLGLCAPGMEFASEMVVKASLKKLRVTEVPTTLRPDGRDGPSHLRSWRDGWRHLRFLLLFSPRGLFLYPGGALFVLASALMLRLLAGPIRIGSIGIDVNTLLYVAAAMSIGWQACLFWVCAKIYGSRSGIVPSDPLFETLARHLSLERVLLASSALFLIGIGLGISSVFDWRFHGFHALDPSRSMRKVIPSVTAMLLAMQSVYGALFVAFLQIRTPDTMT